MKDRGTRMAGVSATQKKVAISRQVPLSMLVSMFCSHTCVLNATDGRTFNAKLHTLRKESVDRISFEGIITEGDMGGRSFTGFYNTNDNRLQVSI